MFSARIRQRRLPRSRRSAKSSDFKAENTSGSGIVISLPLPDPFEEKLNHLATDEQQVNDEKVSESDEFISETAAAGDSDGLYDSAQVSLGKSWISQFSPSEMSSRYSPALYTKLLHASVSRHFASAILKDVTRTFPNHKLFKDTNGRGQKILSNVLRAYSSFDFDIGYSQGFAFIVAFIVLHAPQEFEVFWFLACLMGSDKLKLRSIYVDDIRFLKVALNVTQTALETIPSTRSAALHLSSVSIDSSLFATQQFVTVFCYRFPVWFSELVWQFWFDCGFPGLIAVSIALIESMTDEICRLGFEELVPLLTSVPENYLSSNLIERAREIKIPSHLLIKLEESDYSKKLLKTVQVK